MLRELHIQNLAVIEDARVELDAGLNCFTGQTGAGKSLIIGAFEAMLGLRGASDLLRQGADEARVSGLFELVDAQTATAVGAALDMTLQPGDELLITRKLFSSGRSSFSANGQPVTAPMVRAAGELLVDIHGQHDHQYLLKPSNQLSLLDAFGRTTDQRTQFSELHQRLMELVHRREDLEASRSLRAQQLDLYRFQAEEIDAADLAVGEWSDLKSRHSRLSNAQRLRRDVEQVHAALYESEGAVLDRLQALTQVMLELCEVDESLTELSEQVRTATLTLQDAAFELSRYADRLELDPSELAHVEDRLNTLNRLIAKYGDRHEAADFLGDEASADDPVSRVLAYRAFLADELTRLEGDDDDSSRIADDIAALQHELGEIGAALTDARKRAAKKLKPLVEAELHDLGMADARFSVDIEPLTDGDDPATSASGFDRVEMLVRANPGQPARPLRKVASGGELSRVMLAIKSIVAGNDRISVLVFDEIDANIGGRMGTTIGQKLRALSRAGDRGTVSAGRTQQVLCITHLPQIAAFADRHLRIAKAVEGRGKDKQTRTTVTSLAGAARIAELAEMLAGREASDTTRKQAEELLATALR